MTDEITNDAVDMATSTTGEQSENSQGNFFSNVGDNPTDDNSTGDNPVEGKATKSGKGKGRKPKVEPKQTVSAENNAKGDNPETPKPPKQKRIQLSVYLTPKTYKIMETLSGKTHKSIPDTLAELADEYAEDNEEIAQQIESVLQGFTIKRRLK